MPHRLTCTNFFQNLTLVIVLVDSASVFSRHLCTTLDAELG
jgi:hypothetical protein